MLASFPLHSQLFGWTYQPGHPELNPATVRFARPSPRTRHTLGTNRVAPSRGLAVHGPGGCSSGRGRWSIATASLFQPLHWKGL